MVKDIEYKSVNGFRGILFGKSSLMIFDSNGREKLHTGTRTINTFEELKNAVDSFPYLISGTN